MLESVGVRGGVESAPGSREQHFSRGGLPYGGLGCDLYVH
jgi:hypothetical protein